MATQRGRYITFFTLVGDTISHRQVIFHVGRCISCRQANRGIPVKYPIYFIFPLYISAGTTFSHGINIYIYGPNIFFNRTLTIDSPFQTFVVALPLLSPEMLSSSSKSRIFLCNAHLADTIVVAQTHW